MDILLTPENVEGLGELEQEQLRQLLTIYRNKTSKNAEKDRYYEGHIPLDEVNLGIALPEGMRGLQIGCAWGTKTVDVLAGRSMFDGFVGLNGEEVDQFYWIPFELITPENAADYVNKY